MKVGDTLYVLVEIDHDDYYETEHTLGIYENWSDADFECERLTAIEEAKGRSWANCAFRIDEAKLQ
jgi:hypothetical protein